MAHERLVLGIAGGSSSGKTTVARAVVHALGEKNVAVLQHDAYYKDLSLFPGLPVSEINFDHPDAYDTTLLVENVRVLREGRPVRQPVYDYVTYRRTAQARTVEPRSIILLEGILILSDPRLRDLTDIKVYVETDDDERLLRRIRRDVLERGRSVESVMHQYMHTVKPMHLEFVEPSKRWADIIIPRGGENHIAIDMLLAKLHSLVAA
ncbi:MAG: uridine kinase [Bacteroidota bacterium]